MGKPLSGKTFVCQNMSNKLGYCSIDFKAFEESVKKRLGSDEEPFEGDVPMHEIEKDVMKYICDHPQAKFVFDGNPYPTPEQFGAFLAQLKSLPDRVMCLQADLDCIGERYKKKNEVEEVGEEQVEEFKQQDADFSSVPATLERIFTEMGRCIEPTEVNTN